jgi:hypothetical protein
VSCGLDFCSIPDIRGSLQGASEAGYVCFLFFFIVLLLPLFILLVLIFLLHIHFLTRVYYFCNDIFNRYGCGSGCGLVNTGLLSQSLPDGTGGGREEEEETT